MLTTEVRLNAEELNATQTYLLERFDQRDFEATEYFSVVTVAHKFGLNIDAERDDDGYYEVTAWRDGDFANDGLSTISLTPQERGLFLDFLLHRFDIMEFTNEELEEAQVLGKLYGFGVSIRKTRHTKKGGQVHEIEGTPGRAPRPNGKRYRRAHRRWSKEEDAELLRMKAQGITLREISKHLERSHWSVMCRSRDLGRMNRAA